MPCCLKPSTTGHEDFFAKVGCRVTMRLKGPSETGAEIINILYAGDELDQEPPFQFDVKKGPKMLVVLVEASKPGALLQLIESCNGSEQVLNRFHFDPKNPARGYLIRGS
jgi:hypothetical protein